VGEVRRGKGPALRQADPEVARAIRGELKRQTERLELIASENFTSRAVM
jgi:glycine hydroxymethyltransferase